MDIDPSRPIVILTGAGISKESGLDTFRDADGIWSKIRIEDVATPEAFARDPMRVQEFYNARRTGLLDADVQPNAAHEALAKLQQIWPSDVVIVTQNIDDLHERGGASNVLHMHGELLKARCTVCGAVVTAREDLSVAMTCVTCGEAGGMRPHVVWFGEMPLYMDEIENSLAETGLFMSIGTSGNVYPAAGFVQIVRHYGRAHTVELNMEPSEGATAFTETIYGAATDIVPSYVEQLIRSL